MVYGWNNIKANKVVNKSAPSSFIYKFAFDKPSEYLFANEISRGKIHSSKYLYYHQPNPILVC